MTCINDHKCGDVKQYVGCGICGSFFLWLSFSHSQVVTKKSPFFIQNEDWEQNDVVLEKTVLPPKSRP